VDDSVNGSDCDLFISSLFDDHTDVPLAAQTLAQKLAIGVPSSSSCGLSTGRCRPDELTIDCLINGFTE